MPTDQEKVSAYTSSLFASLRLTAAVDLLLVLLWALVEITLCVFSDTEYSLLGVLFLASLVVLLEAQSTSVRPAPMKSFNVLPLAALDVGVLLAAVLVADQLHRALTTPLLRFSQTMVHKILS